MRTLYILLVIIAFSLFPAELQAGFVVRSVKGNVTVVKGGQNVALKNGMSVSPADKVNIPGGGKLEVMNDINHSIYTSTKEGTFTISRMMLDAKVESDSKFSTINSRLKVGGEGSDKNQRVYVEQGMVKRSLSEYDPEASALSIDPITLARCIKERGTALSANANEGVIKAERGDEGSLTVEIRNTESFPIYFNIISLNSDHQYSLSSIGQPAGSYILLPRQTIMRNHPEGTDASAKQLLVIANCGFDVDSLIEELNKQAEHNPDPLPEFPLELIYF